jgi:arylsulfatase A-like enzyme
VFLVAALVASACTASEDRPPGPTLMEMARSLGSDVVTALRRGYFEGRSGELLLVPKPWHVLGQWNGGLRGFQDPRTTHSSPWSYHQRVPVVLYGPGYIRPGVVVDRPAGVVDIAPTMAELLDTPFPAEGSILEEALLPPARRAAPPKAIVVVAVDGGGWNVLEQWPLAWPAQRDLMSHGTVYTNATIGSAPSVTAPIHATLGTGTYPASHGIVENTGRLPDGTIDEVSHHEARLDTLERRTFADTWDRNGGNVPWVGMLGFESWHLPMIGPGALLPGNDRDVGVLWEREANRFWTNERYYTLPSLPGASALERRLRELDASDGSIDDRWMGEELDQGQPSFTATPAYASYFGDALQQLLGDQPIGTDDATDLLFVELKSGDIAGHVWNMSAPQSREVFEAQDRTLDDLVRTLDARLGPDRYVLVMTADHGQSPIPESAGGLRIDRYELHDDLNAEFDDVVEAVHPTDMYVDPERADEVSLEDIARFIGGYRYEDGLPDAVDPNTVAAGDRIRRVFAAALPGDWLMALTPEQVASLGPGDYPEGDLTSVPSLDVVP